MQWNNPNEVEVPDYDDFLGYYIEGQRLKILFWDPRSHRLYDDNGDPVVIWPDFWTPIDKPPKV